LEAKGERGEVRGEFSSPRWSRPELVGRKEIYSENALTYVFWTTRNSGLGNQGLKKKKEKERAGGREIFSVAL